MNKKFTLIELIVVIITISILLSIVMIKWLDFRKESVRSAMSQNTRIIQTTVDEYYLKNNEFPIKNKDSLSLEHPQLIDITSLIDKGFLKKDLDTKKIKNQYYWVDVFGKVWGSTDKNIESINLFKAQETKKMEFVVGENITGYNIYEVVGYKNIASGKKSEDLYASLEVKPNENSYKLIHEVSINAKEKKVINLELENQEATYLVSIVDEYGLESAPFGKFATNESEYSPLINKIGTYYFEIEGLDKMYWEYFYYLSSTPGDSSISFRFKIKNEEGEYQDWTNDFYSLDPSKGIITEIEMKGDDKGNKPSLYDYKVQFNFGKKNIDTPEITSLPPKTNNEDETCPKSNVESSISIVTPIVGKGNLAYKFRVGDNEIFKANQTPSIRFEKMINYELINTAFYIEENGTYVEYTNQRTTGKCMVVSYEINITSIPPVNEEDYSENENIICGSGGTVPTNRIVDKGYKVYHFYLPENKSISNLKIRNSFTGYNIENVFIEYSHEGAEYIVTDSIAKVPSSSCVNIIYEVSAINEDCILCGNNGKFSSPIEIIDPIISLCEDDCPKLCLSCSPVPCIENCTNSGENSCSSEGNCNNVCIPFEDECIPPVCNTDCSSTPPDRPEPKDKELNDPEWITVDTIRFFGHGGEGQLTRWYKAEHKESIKDSENTRIVYRYSKRNNIHWSNQYSDFTKTGIARSVMGIAYIQVKTEALKSISVENYPEIVSMKFHNEQGVLNLSLVQPTLVIVAEKDNNKDREFFSDTSSIKWSYVAADPRNRAITNVEWGGDVRENYPVGNYVIKARVMNESGYWSEWVTYPLEVKQEKPIAVIKNLNEKNYYPMDSVFNWSEKQSYDPDGDGIVAHEWVNAKSKYPLGKQVVRLRVKDSEGHWSDWTEYTLNISNKQYMVYRLEAEDKNSTFVSGKYGDIANTMIGTSQSASNNKFLDIKSNGYYVEFKVYGAGFDLKFTNAVKGRITYIDDNGEQVIEVNSSGEKLVSVRSLTQGEYIVRVTKYGEHESYFNEKTLKIDYLDVFSEEDEPTLLEVNSLLISDEGKDSYLTNQFSSSLNQSIKVNYTTLFDSNAEVYVTNENNKKIKTIQKNTSIKGGSFNKHTVIWDGKDEAGGFSETGVYNVNIKLNSKYTNKSTIYTYSIELFNDIPIYRIEAESSNTSVVSGKLGNNTNTLVRDNTAASGGKSRWIKTASYYVMFTFEGTGFDLKLENANTAKVYIEGMEDKHTYTFNKKEEKLLSVKDLPLSTYNVYVEKTGTKESTFNDKSVAIDYLDVYSNVDKPDLLSFKSTVVSPEGLDILTGNIISGSINQTLRIDYDVRKDNKTTIKLLNSKKEAITTLVSNKHMAGGSEQSDNFIFDGIVNGSLLPSGVYYLEFTWKGVVKGQTTIHLAELIVMNSEKEDRIEAENVNTGKFGKNTNSRIASSTTSSGGKRREIKTASYYVDFIFTGTGFDLKFDSAYKMKITIINSAGEQTDYPFSLKKAMTFSMRNLDEGEYTVRVTKTGANESYFDEAVQIDYLDYYK